MFFFFPLFICYFVGLHPTDADLPLHKPTHCSHHIDVACVVTPQILYSVVVVVVVVAAATNNVGIDLQILAAHSDGAFFVDVTAAAASIPAAAFLTE